MVVPLAYEKGTNLAAVFDDTGQKDTPEEWQQGHTLIRKLVVFKNKKGENKAVIMYVVPTQKYKNENPKGVTGNNFTGMILFKDYDDEDIFLEGWRMENGEVAEVFGSQSSGKSKKNGRVMDCYFVSYGHWEVPDNARVAYNVAWVWVQDYTDYYCVNGGGGYFEGQLPSGGGGAGFSPVAYNSVNNPQYQAEVMAEFSGVLYGQEIGYLLDVPNLIEPLRAFKRIFGQYKLQSHDVGSIAAIICQVTGRCLNSEEVSILSENNYYLIDLAVYAANAWSAMDVTKRSFLDDKANGQTASDCAVCTGNAFKHALFRILDAHSFGTDRARRLGIAHERNEAPGDEKDMDLFNNEVGLQIFSNPDLNFFQYTPMGERTLASYLDLLNFLMDNGNLEYIKYQYGNIGDPEIPVMTDEPGKSPR